jgi:DNA-binding LacI/PurR family transcriptional regulator
VLVGERGGDGLIDHVGIDNSEAARQATVHLARSGRQRIAFIGAQEPGTLPMADLRNEGYLAALREEGHAIRAEYSRATVAYHRVDGETAMRELLALSVPPDAVFCATDLLALGALRAVYEAGLKVPDDIAIVGFDDLEEGRYSIPSLTTIAPDKQRLARAAVEALAARIDAPGDSIEPRDYVIPFELIVRESSPHS